MSKAPLMPMATAVWLVENTTLTFKQIADFCKLHEVEVQGIADGEVAKGIVGYNPIMSGQLTHEEIKLSSEKEIDCIITTGGTGLTGRDTTPEAIKDLASKHIDGFGELFRQVSFNKIGTSAIQSRAVAALINTTYVFCLPGSTGACKDGWDEILQYQLDIRHKPCNFVEIMPRLNEK